MNDTSSQTAAEALKAVEVSTRAAGNILALDAVSLSVHPGEIYCILGASGAGKSLLLHTFLGLMPPTKGHAYVLGNEVTGGGGGTRRQITYIPKGSPLYGTLSASRNVDFFTKVDGRPVRTTLPDRLNAMRRMGVPERYFDAPARSLGPAVCLALWLAVGFLRDTPILLIDEPTAGLDLYASADLQDCLQEFSTRGTTVLVATSDVLLAGAIADRVGILKEGRKQIELSRRELVGRSLPQLYLEYMGRALQRRQEPGNVPVA